MTDHDFEPYTGWNQCVHCGKEAHQHNDAATVQVRLPATFYNDHAYRDLPSGTVIKRSGSYVTVALDRAAYDDLLSDADYYDDTEMWENYRGLVLSARATKKALAKVPPAMSTADECRLVRLPCGHVIGVDTDAPEQDPATYDCGMCELRLAARRSGSRPLRLGRYVR